MKKLIFIFLCMLVFAVSCDFLSRDIKKIGASSKSSKPIDPETHRQNRINAIQKGMK